MYMVSLGRRFTKWRESCLLEVSVTVPFDNWILLQGKDLLSRVRSLTTATHHTQYSNIFKVVEHFFIIFQMFCLKLCGTMCCYWHTVYTSCTVKCLFFLPYLLPIPDFPFYMWLILHFAFFFTTRASLEFIQTIQITLANILFFSRMYSSDVWMSDAKLKATYHSQFETQNLVNKLLFQNCGNVADTTISAVLPTLSVIYNIYFCLQTGEPLRRRREAP